jgi:hypothetical protein
VREDYFQSRHLGDFYAGKEEMHNINTCSRVLSTVEVNEETRCDVQQNFKADRDWLVGSEQNSKGDPEFLIFNRRERRYSVQ